MVNSVDVCQYKGAFFWDYSSYSYSGLGITEYTEFLFRKERFLIWKRNTHGGGDLAWNYHNCQARLVIAAAYDFPRILSIPSKPYSSHSVHSDIGSRMNGMIFRSFRKRNSSQKNTNTVYSEYSYSGIVPKERALSINVVDNIRDFTQPRRKRQWKRHLKI